MIMDKSKPNSSAVRMLKCHNTDHFDFHFCEGTKFLYHEFFKFNIYMSVAKYKNGIPNQDCFVYSRKTSNNFQEMNTDWKINHWKEMQEYDFYIDIDSPDFFSLDYAKDMSLNVSDYLDSVGVPYQIFYSGMGFHIKIPYKYFKWTKWSFDPDSENNIYKKFKEIATILEDKFGELIDLTIYDPRRVIKIPFSLAYYDYNDIYVCSPLTRDELCQFEIWKYNIKHIELGDIFYKGKSRLSKIINSCGNIKPLFDLIENANEKNNID